MVQPTEKKSPLHEHSVQIMIFHRRLLVASIVVGIMLCILLLRLFYLQVVQYNHYTTLAQDNQLNILAIEPKRGLIVDRNGCILSNNRVINDLELAPYLANLSDTAFTILQNTMMIQPNSITPYINQPNGLRTISLKSNLTETQVANYYAHQHLLSGLAIHSHLGRIYPCGTACANIIGFVGQTSTATSSYLSSLPNALTGKAGIEKQYNDQLNGLPGYQQVEITASGKTVRQLQRIEPTAGNNIILTLNTSLQKIAYEALHNLNGAVVVIEPKTGHVLAMVTSPSFDPNALIQGNNLVAAKTSTKKNGYFNLAVQGQFSLASTIKPFLALKALHDKTISPQTTIKDAGWFSLPGSNHRYRDSRQAGHGMVNLSKAITVSCDTFFYQLAIKMGIYAIGEALQNFGFGSRTGIDLPNEASGLIPSPGWKQQKQNTPWYSGDTIISGIGQGAMLITPLQLATATATLANRGTVMQPTLLYGHISPTGETFLNPIKQIKKIDYSDDNWELVIKAMKNVIEHPQGTGRRFGQHHYTIAAKTGTAQLLHYSRENNAAIPDSLKDNTLFIGFAPIQSPQVAIAVVVEHNRGAITVAKKVLDYYFSKVAVTKPTHDSHSKRDQTL